MNKQTLATLLLATIATFIVLCASGSVFAQDKAAEQINGRESETATFLVFPHVACNRFRAQLSLPFAVGITNEIGGTAFSHHPIVRDLT